ncbi:glycosyltransferase family 39 protein [candidate division KSB1 bacterium]|nr:glycosyltransferase family 39 protein [candidate division KSB1 bacterium]
MTRHDMFWILLVSLVIIGPGIFAPRDFWVEDEARYADVLSNMIHGNHWLVPHLNGQFYPDKPPLYFWLTAAVCLLIGKITPAAGLFITWLSTLGCALMTYRIATRMIDRQTGRLAAIVFLATLLVIICGQIVRMDMLMTLFVMLAIDAYMMYNSTERSALIWLFYLCTALAVFSKGPLGMAFPLLTVIVTTIVAKQWGRLRRVLLHPGWLVIAGIVGGWLALSWYYGYADYVRDILFKQVAGRAVKAFSHREPIYFYLMLLPLVLLPWTPFFPRAIKHYRDETYDPERVLMWWFLSGLGILSVISGKLFIYLLPVLPPLAIIIAARMQTLAEPTQLFRLEVILSSLLTLGPLALFILFKQHLPIVATIDPVLLTIVAGSMIVVQIIVGLYSKIRQQMMILIAGIALLSIFMSQYVLRELNPYFSGNIVGNTIHSYSENGYFIGTYQVRRGIFTFQSGTNFRELGYDELQAYAQQPNRLLLTKALVWEREEQRIGQSFILIGEFNVANEHYLLFRTTAKVFIS